MTKVERSRSEEGGSSVAELAPETTRREGPTGPGSSTSSSALTLRSRLVSGSGAGAGVSREEVGRVGGRENLRKRKSGGQKEKQFSILSSSLIGFLVGMGFLAFAVLVLVGFISFEETAPELTEAAPAEGRQVTYGSVIKLMHDKTKYRLHSHDVPYGTGSGQQSVTGFPGGEDSNSYWVVKPVPEKAFKQGEPVYDGDKIRLFHSKTGKWLHSHLHASPISNNYEVSAFGGAGQSDTGDHWSLMIEGKGNTWLRDQKVRLQHVDTGGYLHSHDKKYSRIVVGQQEVCGVVKKSSDNIWMAAEGVYFPVNYSVEDI